MKLCRNCGESRDDSEFFRVIQSPTGQVQRLPIRDCIRCVSEQGRMFHVARKKRAK